MENSGGPGARQAPKSWKPKWSSPPGGPSQVAPRKGSRDHHRPPAMPHALLPLLASQTPPTASECTVLHPESIRGESRRESKQE